MTNLPISEPIRRQLIFATTFGSLSEVERRTGVDTGQLSRFIGKKRDLMSGTLDALAEYLGMEVVLRGTGKAPGAGDSDGTPTDDDYSSSHANACEVASATDGREIPIVDGGIMSPWPPAIGQRRYDRPCTFPQPIF